MSETPAATPADVPSKAPESDPNAPAVPDADTPIEGEDALGDAGKKALDRMKADLRAAKSEAREAREEAERAKAAADGREAEWEAEKKSREDADQRFNQRILKAELKAAATGKLANPAVAEKFIDLTQFEVSEDGDVDAEALATAVADLLANEPYLSAQGGTKKQVLPDVSQGASASGKASTADQFASHIESKLS